MLPRNLALVDPVVGLEVSHREQRHHQFRGIGLRQPRHVLVDDTLDGIAGDVQIAAQAGRIVEAKGFLRTHQFIEVFPQRHHVVAHADDIFGAVLIDRCRNGIETLERKRVGLLETHHQIVVWVDAEIFDDDAHRRDRAFKVAAGVGERVGLCNSSECAADIVFARDIGQAVGKKACNRDEGQDNDARSHRKRGEHPGQPVKRYR